MKSPLGFWAEMAHGGRLGRIDKTTQPCRYILLHSKKEKFILYTIGGYGMEDQRREIILRLRRIEGQVRGLVAMIERQEPCQEILTQVAAITAAMKRVGVAVLEAYMEECLAKEEGGPADLKKTLKELRTAVSRYISSA
jgi:DNA-binding FrmR family transcriptional regulator